MYANNNEAIRAIHRARIESAQKSRRRTARPGK
jgi:hypothetical protein